MSDTPLKSIRRVVTGLDAQDRSRVAWDGPAPGANPEYPTGATRGHTDLWLWNETPPRLDDAEDMSLARYDFPGPTTGGHLRAVQSRPKPTDYDAATDTDAHAFHEPVEVPTGRRWDRGGRTAYSGDLHKTETVDYAILIEGERVLGLDDGEVLWRPGDVVIDVAAWHSWNSPREHGIVLFDMIAAKFVDGQKGLAQGNDRSLVAPPDFRLPPGVKGTRRIVIADREPGRSAVVSDGLSPDMSFDAARPGFASTRLWVVDSHPAKVVLETLQLPGGLLPPPRGSTLNVLTIPPDDAWKRSVGEREVRPGSKRSAHRARPPSGTRRRILTCSGRARSTSAS